MTFFKTWILPVILGLAIGLFLSGLTSLLAPLILGTGFGAWLASTGVGVALGAIFNYLSATMIGGFATWFTSSAVMILMTLFVSGCIAFLVGFLLSKDNHSTMDVEITQLLEEASKFPFFGVDIPEILSSRRQGYEHSEAVYDHFPSLGYAGYKPDKTAMKAYAKDLIALASKHFSNAEVRHFFLLAEMRFVIERIKYSWNWRSLELSGERIPDKLTNIDDLTDTQISTLTALSESLLSKLEAQLKERLANADNCDELQEIFKNSRTDYDEECKWAEVVWDDEMISCAISEVNTAIKVIFPDDVSMQTKVLFTILKEQRDYFRNGDKFNPFSLDTFQVRSVPQNPFSGVPTPPPGKVGESSDNLLGQEM